MKIADSKEMKAIDNYAIQNFGIPGIVLMENAAIKVAKHVLGAIFRLKGKRITLICGKGNNGGDGFAVARLLYVSGIKIDVYLIGNDKDIKGDALINYKILNNIGLKVTSIDAQNLAELYDNLKSCDIIIDAILGTGTRGEVTGLYKKSIDLINGSQAYVISVDIPSGIDADTGKILGTAVRADKTVTFVIPKIGLYTYPGAAFTGEIAVEDISIPCEAIEKQNISVNLLTPEYIKGLLPVRRKDTNKGSYGRAVIIGGSENMMGAPAMSGLAALKSGAGIVEVCVPQSIKERVAPVLMEAIVHGLDEKDGTISLSSLDKIKNIIKKASSLSIGPGISKSDDLKKLLFSLIEFSDIPLIIDADGLNILSEDTSILRKAKGQIIITPHPGEMSRLIGKSIDYIQINRTECAREFSSIYNVITLLKGTNTIIAQPSGEVYINPTGNPGMAKGGSGDVLTGIISSFAAMGLKPIGAVNAGVYIHGLAGDLASKELGEYGMKAGDIIEFIPAAIKSIMLYEVITKK
ncbi:bifunctional NAD(P)H-hydrate repair enzyme Nnr [Oxobacter pfennigii]|uniref:Bifunctional NAD(P)H-hydrate repair enzyme n=1 Tax=Oxobacter pfennigii TaxID=36849 RepID=A0A0P8W5Z2_9CLOT|nr:bifunctional ADP-dependent NAD(P)H-hydrate dehydratase/NAD(P)H-hydrate epimerase [Oxobacter pfennigii]KPU43404.1 bifunctional NAD(P)H-hydrate repair enzyme Nnr [Oxobacter pfennigii]